MPSGSACNAHHPLHRSDFLDHAKRSQEEVLSTAQKEWAALVEDMLKTKYTVLQVCKRVHPPPLLPHIPCPSIQTPPTIRLPACVRKWLSDRGFFLFVLLCIWLKSGLFFQACLNDT